MEGQGGKIAPRREDYNRPPCNDIMGGRVHSTVFKAQHSTALDFFIFLCSNTSPFPQPQHTRTPILQVSANLCRLCV